MEEEKKNKRKATILMIVGVITLIALVIGATYAYFQAQVGTGKSAALDVKAGTTDDLSFSLSDLNAAKEKVVDNDTSASIVINANQTNFASGNDSIADGVTGTATLIAGDDDYKAEGTYNVYLNITKNELKYSSYIKKVQDETPENVLSFKDEAKKVEADLSQYNPRPELYLTIKKNGVEIKKGVTVNDKELNYSEKVFTKDDTQLGGFDITETKGLIKIEVPATITVNGNAENHTTTDTWEITVTFMNLDTDQNLNAGKSVTGNVIIQSDEVTLATICKDEEFGSCMAANYKLDNALIKHDGDNSDSGSDLEAGDDSIRYTGGNTIISEDVVSKIVNDLYETADLLGEMKIYWLKDSSKAARIKELVEQINNEDISGIDELEELIESGDLLWYESGSLMTVAQDAAKRGLLSNYEGVETLNNYVCVGVDCQNNNLYRIIGSFKNKDGNYELKLIKETAGSEELGTNDAYSSNYDGYLWNSSNGLGEHYISKNINSWKESNLNTKNLNGYYYNTYLAQNEDLKNMITNHTWTVGGGSKNDLINSNAKTAYEAELGSNKVKEGDVACYNEVDGAKVPCTQEDVEYWNDNNSHIGLMYISDYYYAASSKYWNLPGYSDGSSDYRTMAVEDWLLPSYADWTISRLSDSSQGAFRVTSAGFVLDYGVDYSSLAFAARPVFYLESGVKLKEGNGSKEKPYVL